MADEIVRQPAIQRAIDVVGWNPSGNISLYADAVESRHLMPLRCLLPESKPLVEALESGPVQDALRLYRAEDEKALREQRAYQWQARCVVLPLALAVLLCVSAFMVPSQDIAGAIAAVTGAADEGRNKIEVIWLQVVPWVIYGGAVLAAILVKWLKPKDQYRAWQEARGQAEALRRELFRRLLDAKPASPPAAGGPSDERTWTLLLKLEYFRRWQFELQEEYFRKRARNHRRTVGKAGALAWAYAIALAVLGVTLLLSIIGGADEQGQLLSQILAGPYSELSSMTLWLEKARGDHWLLLVTLLTAGLLVHLYLQTFLGASVRNAPRFENMARNFEDLKARLETVRLAGAQGNEKAVRDFVTDVHAIMSLELNDWVRLADLDMGRDRASFAVSPVIAPGQKTS